MITRIYAVYDSKVGAYLPPVYAPSKGAVIRSIGDAVNDPSKQHQFAKYPADFTLFELGEFDDNSGQFKLHETKQNLGVLTEFKETT